MISGHEFRAKVIICSPLLVMVTSPYERTILEWDDKPQTNEQTNQLTNFLLFYSLFDVIEILIQNRNNPLMILEGFFFTPVSHNIIHTLRLFRTCWSIMKQMQMHLNFYQCFHTRGSAIVQNEKWNSLISLYISTVNVFP